jgi:hypothetical protein
MAEMTGGCLCGQVRYTANADPVFVGVCHCTHCQKQTGTAFSVLVGIPKSAMSIQGRLKTFHDTGDIGQPVERKLLSRMRVTNLLRCRRHTGTRFYQRLSLSMTRVGSILKCASVATARSPGLSHPKAAKIREDARLSLSYRGELVKAYCSHLLCSCRCTADERCRCNLIYVMARTRPSHR